MKALALAAALGLAATGALAQEPQRCAPRDEHIAFYAEIGAVRLGLGVAADGILPLMRGKIMELYATPQGGWVLLMTAPDGMSCAINSGLGWEVETPPVQGDPA